jgi:predicted transcriptional regulator
MVDMSSTNELLQHFSLSPQEAELYLLLLKQGASNVSNLAHLQKKNRAAVYFHLNHLLERGLVKETRVGRRAEYLAMPPKELGALLERWTTDFKSLIPELESLQRAERDKPMIEVIESSVGMKRIYDEITVQPEGSEFLVLEGKGAVKGELKLMSMKEWETFFRRIVERNILTRAVFTRESMDMPRRVLPEETKKVFRARKWDLRSLPESAMPLEHLMYIYGDKAAFYIPESKLLFTLKHPGIVGILRLMFNTIHGIAQPVQGGW